MEHTSEKPLRIAMACDPITDYIAGVFMSTLRFSERLSKRGHHVIFLAAKSPFSVGVDEYKGMPIYRFRSVLMPKSEKRVRLALPTISEVKQILKDEQIDILHILLPTPLAFISIRAARSLGIKIVIHSHAQPENTSMHIPRWAGRTLINAGLGTFFSWLYRQADSLVYPTEFAQKIFASHNLHIPNVVISNGIDTQLFSKVPTDALFETWKLPRDTKNILFVGRLHPEKNVETLIRSIPLILIKEKKVHLYIVGPGYQKDELRRLAASLFIDSHITFFGKVTDAELIMAYNACDVFVLPSIAELEGMVVLEAMACGKPIVISDSTDSASKYFVRDNGFLFSMYNPQDLADKVLMLLSDDALRKTMGEKSLLLSKEYAIDKSVTKLEEVYYSLL